MKTIHLLSGGLDSTVMLYDLKSVRATVQCIGFDYGQRHFKEIDAAKKIAGNLGLSFQVVQLARVFGGRSSLLGDSPLADSFVVPNRNMVFLSVAAAIAASRGFDSVTYGCTLDDFNGFPDCRPAFISAMNVALQKAETGVQIVTPYAHKSKREIVQIGRSLQVPMHETWTCYLGNNEPCNECPSCKLRNEALA